MSVARISDAAGRSALPIASTIDRPRRVWNTWEGAVSNCLAALSHEGNHPARETITKSVRHYRHLDLGSAHHGSPGTVSATSFWAVVVSPVVAAAMTVAWRPSSMRWPMPFW